MLEIECVLTFKFIPNEEVNEPPPSTKTLYEYLNSDNYDDYDYDYRYGCLLHELLIPLDIDFRKDVVDVELFINSDKSYLDEKNQTVGLSFNVLMQDYNRDTLLKDIQNALDSEILADTLHKGKPGSELCYPSKDGKNILGFISFDAVCTVIV